MPKKSIAADIHLQVKSYLEIAIHKLPAEFPINVQNVALDLNVSRTTLYKYSLDTLIKSAVIEQRKNAKKSGKLIETEAFKGIIRELREELKDEKEKSNRLYAKILIMEANAVRLGIDPEEYYRDISKPDRTLSKAGNVRKFRLRK